MFEGYGVVVTGAGVGIGYAICQAFAEAGAFVALNDIDGNLAGQAAAQINEQVGAEQVTPYALDVADVEAVRAMIRDFAARYDRLDVVIANAGITNYGSFLDYTPAAFDRLTAVNLRGSYFTAQAGAREMLARKTAHGRIILMASATGILGFPNLTAYGVTKAGICHMARTLATEISPLGITVNSITPGPILTERTLADDPAFAANWGGVTPVGRPGYVQDVANAALLLASPASDYITGHNLVADGGWSTHGHIPEGHPDEPQESSKLR
jgi:3-oxoacyl-[acyl-carrier protein] reductase